MAQEQTSYAGDDVQVVINVVGSSGSHVAATINTTTTRIHGNSAAPTITTIATGIYKIVFSGVTPAPAEGDRLIVKINGAITGQSAWSEYGIPVKILKPVTAIKTTTDKIESMLQGSSSTQTNNFDTDFGDWSTVGYGGGVGSDTTRSTTYAQSGTHSIQMVNANETADRTGIAQTLTIASGGGTVSGYYYNNRSSHNTDLNLELWIDGTYVSEFTPSSTQTWVQFSFNLSAGSQTVALVRYQDEDAASGVVYIDTISVTNVASTSNYKYTADALSATPSSGGGGLDAAGVRTAIGLSSANLDTQLSDMPTVSEFNARTLAAADYFDPASDVVTTDTASRDASKADLTSLNDISASDVYTHFTSGSNEDAFKADVSALATASSIAALNNFNPATQVVTTDAASRTASQADVSALATSASIAALNDLDALGIRTAVGLASANLDIQLSTIDTVADAVQFKTDQLTFTTANSVDATAIASVDTAAIANAVLAGIGGADVTITSPVASDGTTITIVRGDDYNSSDSRQITWIGATADQWPSLSGATLSLTATNRLDSLTVVPTVTSPTGTQAFQLELTADQTNIGSGRYQYDVQATLASGRVVTLLSGELIVKKSYTD